MTLSDRAKAAFGQPYLLALAGALILMAFAFVNGYAVFFNDTRSYVHGPDLAIKALTGKDLAPEWRSTGAAIYVVGRAEAFPPAAVPVVEKPAEPPVQVEPSVQKKAGRLIENAGFTANRSIYYGVIAFLGYVLSDFWLTIFFQAYLIAAALAVIMKRYIDRYFVASYLSIVLILSIFSTVGPFVAFIMPDVLAAAMVLAVGALFCIRDRLSVFDQSFLYAIIAFACLAHPSHVVILAVLAAGFAALKLFQRALDRKVLTMLLLLGACLGVAVIGQVAFNKAIVKATGERPLVLPHIMAHLIDMGPGYRFIVKECPTHPFAVCRYKDRLPMYWEDFLGNPDPAKGVYAAADLPTKHQLSEEQMKFAIDVVAFDPVGVAVGLAKDAVAQIFRFSLKDMQVTPAAMANYAGRYPANVTAEIANSTIGRSSALLNILSVTNLALVLASFGVLAWRLASRSRAATSLAEPYGFYLFIVLAVLVNAIVCGAIASPYDRFQARVIWLVPLIALLHLARFVQVRANQRVSVGR